MDNRIGYFISSFLGIVMGAMLIIGGNKAGILKLQTYNDSSKITSTQLQQITAPVYENTSAISSIAKRVTPTVVGITSTKNLSNTSNEKSGMGSGIIVDKGGYILTNNHVANKLADEIKIYLYDGRTAKGKIAWSDENLDLSIIKINADNLTTATLGDSEKAAAGDTAIAIGNPLGLTFQRTVTSGIISATNRTVGETGKPLMGGLLQTDASINPGNSGGPLINIDGEIIGINTIKVTDAEGMGFAIPINITKPILKSILEKGTFTTPTMGIDGFDTQMALLMDDVNLKNGIYVTDLVIDGPAYKAGIKKGDTILAVNDKPVDTLTQLRYELFNAGYGSSVTVKVKGSLGIDKNLIVRLI